VCRPCWVVDNCVFSINSAIPDSLSIDLSDVLSGLGCDGNFCALHMSLPGRSRHFAPTPDVGRSRTETDIDR